MALLAATAPLAARTPTPSIARLLCDPTLFTASPASVRTMVRTRLGVAPIPGDGSDSLTIPAHGVIQEGQLDFQPGDQLYGPSVPKTPRLRMLRLVTKAAPGTVSAIRHALDRCAGRRAEINGTSATWSLSHRRMIGIDKGEAGQTELTASVDQSDIAE